MSIFDNIYSRPLGSKVSSISDDSDTPRKVKSGDSDTGDNSSSSRARSDSQPDLQDPGSDEVLDPTCGPGSQALTLQLTQIASSVDKSRVQSLNDLGDMYGAFEKTYKDLRRNVELQNQFMSRIVEQMNNIKDHYQRIDTEREVHQSDLAEDFPDVARKVFKHKPANRHRINSLLTPTINKSKKRRGSQANQHSSTEPKRRKVEEDCVTLAPSSIVPTKFTTSKQRRP